MALRRLVLWSFLCGLAGGCASIRDPDIDVISASLRETTAEAIAFDVVLELSNPNSEPLQLLEVDYRVRVDGAEFNGRRAARSTLRPNGQQRIVVPAVARIEDMPAGAVSEPVSVRGTLQFMKPGKIAEVLFDAGLQRPKASFKGDVVVEPQGN